MLLRFTIITALTIFVMASAVQVYSQAGVREGTIAIVVQDLADDSPVPVVTVRVVERGGKPLASGITNAEGRYEARVDLNQAFAILYERVGYVRHPETIVLAQVSPANLQRGRLLRNNGNRAYYESVGMAIETLAASTGTGQGTGWVAVAQEMDRASSLPPDAVGAIESGLSEESRTRLNMHRELLAKTKTPGNSLAATYSVSPVFGTGVGWVGIPSFGLVDRVMRDAIMRGLSSESSFHAATLPPSIQRNQWSAYRDLVGEALTFEKTPNSSLARLCVTAVGYCPLIAQGQAGAPCACYTAAGMFHGLGTGSRGNFPFSIPAK